MITLPIYYTHKVKGKQKTILVGMNAYERMFYIPRNKMKKHFYSLIRVTARRLKPIKGMVATHYTVFYKNKASDAPNIVAVIDKMLMDALQENGVIEQDNVQSYVRSSWEVGGQDTINPRIEIKIFEVVD